MTHEQYLDQLIRKILRLERIVESGINKHDALTRWLAHKIAVYIASENVRWRTALSSSGTSIARMFPPVVHSVRVQQRWNPPHSQLERVEVRFSVAPNQPVRRIVVSLREFQNDTFRLNISGDSPYGLTIVDSAFVRFEHLPSGRFRFVSVAPLRSPVLT